ncbi:hypothetical protein TorRG33x02_076350 [Trema orientale]|uniref:Uncharacterized protein n=1 Tax=Trema orientale TaxID=63057 RepID=A0A2P5FFV8_TREOI|nr:hypothetical protein TorRG33x02_076350 [Trema orientale]
MVAIDKDAYRRSQINGQDLRFTSYESRPLDLLSSLSAFGHKKDRSMHSMLSQWNPIIPCPFH